MDVDAGTMEGASQGRPPPYQGRGGFTQLSDSEKADLIAKRACFKCKQPGHISRWCVAREGRSPKTLEQPCTRDILCICLEYPAPEKASIESVGGIEGLYDLLKNGTEAEKKSSSTSHRIFKGPRS